MKAFRFSLVEDRESSAESFAVMLHTFPYSRIKVQYLDRLLAPLSNREF